MALFQAVSVLACMYVYKRDGKLRLNDSGASRSMPLLRTPVECLVSWVVVVCGYCDSMWVNERPNGLYRPERKPTPICLVLTWIYSHVSFLFSLAQVCRMRCQSTESPLCTYIIYILYFFLGWTRFVCNPLGEPLTAGVQASYSSKVPTIECIISPMRIQRRLSLKGVTNLTPMWRWQSR